METYRLLLSKKEYALIVVEANNEQEAIEKAYDNKYDRVIYDPEKLPDGDYVVEKVFAGKQTIEEDFENARNEIKKNEDIKESRQKKL